MVLRHEPEARTAHRRVLVGGSLADQAHQRRTGPREGRCAHHASRPLGDAPEDLAHPVFPAISTGEIVVPELVVVTLGIAGRGHRGQRRPPRKSPSSEADSCPSVAGRVSGDVAIDSMIRMTVVVWATWYRPSAMGWDEPARGDRPTTRAVRSDATVPSRNPDCASHQKTSRPRYGAEPKGPCRRRARHRARPPADPRRVDSRTGRCRRSGHDRPEVRLHPDSPRDRSAGGPWAATRNRMDGVPFGTRPSPPRPRELGDHRPMMSRR